MRRCTFLTMRAHERRERDWNGISASITPNDRIRRSTIAVRVRCISANEFVSRAALIRTYSHAAALARAAAPDHLPSRNVKRFTNDVRTHHTENWPKDCA